MKSYLLLFTLLFFGILHAEEAETIFTIRNLKGESQVYTDKDRNLLDHPKKDEDRMSNTVYIQRESKDGKEAFFIVHTGGRTEILPITGEKSLTFLESYGDNNFLWTICLDKRDEAGAFFVIYTNIKANGAAGLIYSQTMTGKAYMTK